MSRTDYAALNVKLTDLLKLAVAPIALTFMDAPPAGLPRPGGTMPAPTADGRTGAVAASCVFWMMAPERSFATIAADHGNCSVGSLTHGFKTLAEAATGADVAALVQSEWVSPNDFPHIAAVSKKPGAIVYGPLAAVTQDPDVVFLRLNGKQLMLVHDALPGLRVEGKPQCHIVALAKEQNVAAASSGCMLSRVRTGMSNNEMTFALPAKQLPELIQKLEIAQAADMKVAAYAAADASRFPARA